MSAFARKQTLNYSDPNRRHFRVRITRAKRSLVSQGCENGSRLLRRGTPPKSLTRVCHSDRSCVSSIAAIPCAKPFNVDDVACIHFVACPAPPEQTVCTDKLNRPVPNVTVVVFGVDEEPRVGVRPLDSRDGARQLHGPGDIELGGKRVVWRSGYGRQKPRRTDENHGQSFHDRGPLTHQVLS